MKSFATIFSVIILSASLLSADAEAARRLGGGKSVGMQREAVSAPKNAPAATPGQQAAAQPSPMQSAPAANPGQVCPAKWNEGAKTLTPSLDLVGKI